VLKNLALKNLDHVQNSKASYFLLPARFFGTKEQKHLNDFIFSLLHLDINQNSIKTLKKDKKNSLKIKNH
jgi:hypothetical protein